MPFLDRKSPWKQARCFPVRIATAVMPFQPCRHADDVYEFKNKYISRIGIIMLYNAVYFVDISGLVFFQRISTRNTCLMPCLINEIRF